MTSIASTERAPAAGWRPEPMSERIVVRSYATYHEAKRAADQLTVVARIPPKHISVFGRGLRWREAWTASRFVKAASAGGAALAGAAALILWSLGALDSSFTWLTAAAVGATLGGTLGLGLGATVWRVTRRSRSVPETGHVDIDRYELLVGLDSAERARAMLDVA